MWLDSSHFRVVGPLARDNQIMVIAIMVDYGSGGVRAAVRFACCVVCCPGVK